ncbi:AAA family ATPase [bacterium]|nr:AAA family ATPase [bacterium]
MITKIVVNGFRSLSDFTLDLLPGLNILVGPNGSGKTNIITFFEFLSHMVTYGPSEAVNRIGGAGSVFTKQSEQEFQKYIDVQILGCTESDKKFIQYIYNFIIEASLNFDSIRFRNQLFKLKPSNVFDPPIAESLDDAFCVSQTSNDCKEYSLHIDNYKKGIIDSSFLPPPIRKEFLKNSKMIEEFLKNNLESDMPLISSLSFLIDATRYIFNDLRGGQVFNIIPSKVKHPEESSSPIGIQRDGSGLAATLYAIKNKKLHDEEILFPGRFIIRRHSQRLDIRETSIENILKYLETANSAIRNIDVENDRFDNLLKVKLWIEKKDHSTVLPLSSMSDGTIKWLSLVTAILTSPSIFSLEEPENFLHPHMQSEVVRLMRNAASSKRKKNCMLLSTHSETILNSANPNEIVIVSFMEGKTRANRCSNQEEIMYEIQETGFGLGFYYISGSMIDE